MGKKSKHQESKAEKQLTKDLRSRVVTKQMGDLVYYAYSDKMDMEFCMTQAQWKTTTLREALIKKYKLDPAELAELEDALRDEIEDDRRYDED
jgi:hypothetical protein